MRQELFDAIAAAFNPYSCSSGTESVGPLLYALVRMRRCQTVTEFGSGFTTAFIATALAENARDDSEHRASLACRARRHEAALSTLLGDDRLAGGVPLGQDRALDALVTERVGDLVPGSRAPIAPNPSFYLRRRTPHLFTFDPQPETHPYLVRLRALLDDLGLAAFVTVVGGARIDDYMQAVPPERRPVDLAWNDFGHKLRFFEQSYPHLADDGGMLVFHSPADFPEDVAAIRRALSSELVDGRCEMATLDEPHKLMQNGCLLVTKRAAEPEGWRASARATLTAFRELGCTAGGLQAG